MQIFKVTILGWEEHNPGKKKSHKKTLIANNLISDARIVALPVSTRWLYLALLLLAGDNAKETVTITERQVNDILSTREGASKALSRLEEFQLVTIEVLNKRKEKKEIKGNEIKEGNQVPMELEKEPPANSAAPVAGPPVEKTSKKKNRLPAEESELNRKIWESYRDAYRTRYRVEPVRNATVNGQISSLRKRLGQDAVDVVAFFVTSNHAFYMQKTHSIGLCLADAESLFTQWQRGHAITRNDVRNFEKVDQYQSTLEKIKRGDL